MIEILSSGALNLVQDLGRPAYADIGVSGGGAMDIPALALANLLVGNDMRAAGIEVSLFPLRLRLLQDTFFACTGCSTRLTLAQRSLPGWWAAHGQAGELLTLAAPTNGARAYLAFSGGIDVPLVLGSRSTDLKGAFGGFKGRGLRKGDILMLDECAKGGRAETRMLGVVPTSREHFERQLVTRCITVRVLPAAEYDEFEGEAAATFQNSEYRLTPECNRQGYRLKGPVLQPRRTLNLLSHGIVPGTIQVPPSGQPIVQLAEANTCGGYPKIATVIEPDLWRLAQLRPGHSIRFKTVDHEAALSALTECTAEFDHLRHGLSLMRIPL